MDDQRLSIQAALTAKADHNVINEAIEQIRIEVGRRPIRILDVGCGTGEVTCSRFQHLDQIDVTAIDASKEAIEIARQRCTSKKIRFQASVLDQVPANRFDLIFCSYSAHHNASSFLQEVWSRLRPDGTLLVRTCNDRLFTVCVCREQPPQRDRSDGDVHRLAHHQRRWDLPADWWIYDDKFSIPFRFRSWRQRRAAEGKPPDVAV
ncbi:MAG: class I SAM-dependent methyltransferase [Maricaulis sp.]|uniref:class I SAM-dependent methyltransferase n=1 Tax=Maricaulis sp. TaxID=1486257 RepID=UPI001B1D43C4|nr:class I SAM-dependent methyltransferase [Maricaulis sp.]MBO6848744.1 class I SAM-dependent methyltransferase [Maricaulis sp.]MBO6878727.1 class I SAM-dependent methyltransferase [Maricaulis sp.]